MYKVFIVEDEVVVREGLRDNIPWEQYGFVFAGSSSDGEIALPQIRRVRPDVLITDIRMPFMDGLSLCRIVRAELPDVLIVILSGYDDFEYARQAIEIGVEKYMTKPITRRAMTRVLCELAKKLERKKEQEDSLLHSRGEFHAYERFKKRKFFEDVFAGRFTVEEIFTEAGRLGLDLTGPAYRILLADIYEPGSDGESRELLLCREDAIRFFLRHPQYLMTEWTNDTLCIIVKGEQDIVETYTGRALEHLRQVTQMYGKGKTYFLCVSDMAERFSSLQDCYEQVSQYFTCRYLPGGENVVSRENFLKIVSTIQLTDPDRKPGRQTLEGQGGEMDNAGNSSALQRAIDYIDQNFADEKLTLALTASAAQVSQGYFSALFSQKMGMTFIEYVTAKRIEKAKQILENTCEYTAAIAAMVGYKDPNYFRFVFKKVTGMTPREYRNRR